MKSTLAMVFLGFLITYAIITAVLYIRCLSHLQSGYRMHLWNPAWIFDRDSVNEAGQTHRKTLIYLAIAFPLIAFSGASFLEHL